MIKQSDILNAYLFLRENNHSIPSETLTFMKDVSMRELKKIAANAVSVRELHQEEAQQNIRGEG